MRSIEFLREAAPIANPYTGADAAKFAAMSPQDQQALTKGGGKPDINDQFILGRLPGKGKAVAAQPAAQPAAAPANPYQGADAARFAALTPADQQELTYNGQRPDLSDQYILNRLPNQGKPAAGGTLPAGAPSKPLTWTDSSGNPVQDSSGNPVQAGAGQPVNPPPTSAQEQLAANIAAVRRAEQAALGAGAQASTLSAEQSAAVAAPAAERSPEQDMGAGKAPAPQEDDIETAMYGAGKAQSQAPAASALPAGMTQAEFDQARNAEEPDAVTTIPAASARPAGMTQAQIDQARNAEEPDAVQTVAPAANYDSMTFNQAFAAARKAGAKDFMWRNKKYAVQMAPGQGAKPNPFPAGTVKNAAGGQTTTNAGGAATSVTRNNRPVVPGSLRAQQQANQAAGQAGTPAPAGKPTRYKTPQEYDREIARFSKTSDPKLAPNARYIATLKAEKSALAGAAPAKQAATPAAATPTTSGGRPFAAPAARTFEESVDLMRRLSNILKE
jgi:hypothetical protein